MNAMKKPAVARQGTEQRIYKASLELLQEKGYEGISVSDIINRSGVARSTFYRHFTSVHDVLVQYGYRLARQLKRGVGDEPPSFFDRTYLIRLFRSFQENHHDFAVMSKTKAPAELAELIVGYYEMELGTMPSSSPKRYALYYHAGALCSVLLQWMDAGMNETPEQMADIFLKLAEGHPEDIG